MWTAKELERIGKTFINDAAKLEDFLDEQDLGAIKSQGITYYNLRDKIFAPKVFINRASHININRI